MTRYYTRVCNFYYGAKSKILVEKNKSLPLHGIKEISFDQIEIITRKSKKIDLALLFTWRTIARMKNSTNTNLLIMDEVFDASLDVSGCEEFLKLIHEMGGDQNCFVITHKGDLLQDKFFSSIRFEKHKNFSRIAA